MISIVSITFRDSGYYLDNKKDVKKLDSGYYLYVYKNVGISHISIENFFNRVYMKDLN